ncbi:histidine phosphatase family protein [uncultured Umboniibacter sp.]|uniref:histidine phosphatase family protein n=1 Tax=uncultured Umboniibacter sp. TaxID=1798917 RepID=UPI00262ACC1E|nr:histidine phosphatase family protein [uncultured Umboniibacter sp.]
MPKLYVVRHGHPQSKWNEDPDPSLSEQGRAQASEIIKILSGLSFSEVVSSPMIRAAETAMIAAAGHDIKTEQAIREIPSYWIPSSQRHDWLNRVLRSTWDEVEPEINVWRNHLLHWASALKEDTVAFSHFVVINALLSAATDSNTVVTALPDHCAIAEFDVIDGQLHFIGIDRELDSEIMV